MGDLQVRVSGARFRLSGTCWALCVGVPLANVEKMAPMVEVREKLSLEGVWRAIWGVMGLFVGFLVLHRDPQNQNSRDSIRHEAKFLLVAGIVHTHNLISSHRKCL